jgi:CBS domain-containing protein/ribosome-associated translation inhibitor RaiA
MNPERTSVSRIMFKPPNISPNTALYDVASALIDNRVRIIPAVDNDSISGVVRQSAILSRMVDCPDLKEFSAGDLMVSNPVTVDLNSSVAVVRSLMLSKGFSHAPVVDQNGDLKGIITAYDLVGNFFKPRGRVTVGERKGEKERLLNVSIKGVIDRHPLDVTPRTRITIVVREMVTLNKGYCLVVEKHKPVGIITPRDIIGLLNQFKPRIQIPLYIFGLKGEDEAQIELAKRKIERVASRGLQMHPDLLEIVVHGKVSKTDGNKRKYTLKARAVTLKETLAANATGWDLPSVFDIVSDRIDKRLKQVKASEKRSKSRKPRTREQLLA